MKIRSCGKITALLIAGLGTVAAGERSAGANAMFVINNLDPAGQGFNDPTVVTAVGGNSGTTLGQQRMNVFLWATQTWGRAIDSNVPIVIDAHFAPLACGAVITLGQAAAVSAMADLPGLPPDVYYPQPLAERIVGYDLSEPPGSADITAVFNGGLSDCDPTLDWYYGLDGQSGDLADLAEIVLHELTHGLGFTSLVDLDAGTFSSGIIDTFSQHIFDNSAGLMWSAMTDSQRQASIQNVRHLVWSGTYVMAATAAVLAKGAPLLVAAPAITGFSGNLGEMNFGPLVANMGATGPLFVGNPTDGCSTLATHAGGIFLLQGGNVCSPLNQVDNATTAGAKAVLLTDQNGFSPPSSLELPASQLQILPVHIPVVAITDDDGQLLASHSGETVTLSGQSARLVGADDAGRPYLYASVPIRPGSSVSHWDTLARPDLLEEPQTGYVHNHDITMETALLRDIGWTPLPCGDGGACNTGAGGSTGTGGNSGAGGNSGTGGKIGTGGNSGVGGGSSGTGGGNSGTGGGNSGTGGKTSTNNDAGTTPPPPPKSGCGCATGNGRPLADLSLLTLMGTLALTRTVRRRR